LICDVNVYKSGLADIKFLQIDLLQKNVERTQARFTLLTEKFGLENLIEEVEFQIETLCLSLNRLYQLFSIFQNEFNEIKS